ncbi:MAG: hypothetical protein P8Q14_10870 [Vicingaceae bacterium]|nr:hypothetical protein [Vicingaceae bacterium]
MRLIFFTILLLAIFSCNNTTKDQSTENDIKKIEKVKDLANKEVETESKYQYDKEWEVFKEAVINKDIKGVAAFASSDAIDAEFLITVMDNEILLQKLRETKYEDLKVNETEQGVSLEFYAIETTIDEDGNEVGSAISIFFTEGDQFLELDYFVVAG